MQNSISIAYAKKDQNLFILDLAIPRKVMQVNTQGMIITGQGRLMHLISCIKKIHIWHKRFGYASNAKVIRALKLLIGIGDFGENYNLVEIYSDFKASKPEKSRDNPNPIDNNSASTNITIETTMKASKIINSNFDKICEPCVENKQTWVMR